MGCGSSTSKSSEPLVVEPSKQHISVKSCHENGGLSDTTSYDLHLPQPRPPKDKKEDLLEDKLERMAAMDKQALTANNNMRESSSLSAFTTDHLLPPKVQISQTPKIVFSPPAEPSNKASLNTAAISKDDVQKQLDQFDQQQERENEFRKEHKRRQQALLQEKLRERRKRKQLAEVAATVNGEAPKRDDSDLLPKPFVADAVLDEAPKPEAPATTKDVLYSEENIALFRDLETYAVNMDSEHVSFATLMEGLYISDLSDLEKVRILFHWITAQNLNTINFPTNLSDDTPLGYLKAIKNEEKSYASLFLRLCSAAGLHAKLVRGYLKGVGYCPDYKFLDKNDSFRGTWNAVLIDGQWRLIDTHWGARHVTEDDSGVQENRQTKYKYEEHYFLTDPDMLINTHYPDEPEWQLLQSPVTLQQYEKFVKQWPLFYKLQLAQESNHCGMVEASDVGFVQIKIKTSVFARNDAKFKAELRHRHRLPSSGNNTELQKNIFHYSTDVHEIFEVYLPSTGMFLFKVFALSNKFSDDNLFTNVCLYQINCSKIKSHSSPILPPFPVIGSSYGPGASARAIAIKPVTHPQPTIECDENGEATIVMTTDSSCDHVTFSQDLRDADSAVHDGHAVHTVIQSEAETHIVFYVRVPYNGNFALNLYSNSTSEERDILSSFCHYLLLCKNLKKPTVPFSASPKGRLGALEPDFGGLGLSFSSHTPKSARGPHWLNTDASSECSITFQLSQPLTLIANLSLHSTNFDDYVMVETDGRCLTVRIRAPPNTQESSVLLLKIFAAPLYQTQGIPVVFTAFITCPTTSENTFPWPQAPSRVWGPVFEKWQSFSITSAQFIGSEPMQPQAASDLSSRSSPCRIYDGTGEFELVIDHQLPLQIKAKLTELLPDGELGEELEQFALACKNTVTESRICARFPRNGMYFLIVYGELVEDRKGHLMPLHYSLIHALKPCPCIDPFPIPLALWSTSCVEANTLISGEVKRNNPITFRLKFGRFFKDTSGNYAVAPYPKILLLVDGSTAVEPSDHSECTYEWKYLAGPAEKRLGMAVQLNEAEQSMSYALQFDIVN